MSYESFRIDLDDGDDVIKVIDAVFEHFHQSKVSLEERIEELEEENTTLEEEVNELKEEISELQEELDNA